MNRNVKSYKLASKSVHVLDYDLRNFWFWALSDLFLLFIDQTAVSYDGLNTNTYYTLCPTSS